MTGSSSSSLDSEEYEVDKLVDRRRSTTDPNTYDYKIRWKHYDSDDDTWENEKDISAPVLLMAYDATHPRTPLGSPMPEVSDTSAESDTSAASEITTSPKVPQSPGSIPSSLRAATSPQSDAEPPLEVGDNWISRVMDVRKLSSGRIRYLIQFTDDLGGEYEWRDESEVGTHLRMLFFRGHYDQENQLNPVTVVDNVAVQEEKESEEDGEGEERKKSEEEEQAQTQKIDDMRKKIAEMKIVKRVEAFKQSSDLVSRSKSPVSQQVTQPQGTTPSRAITPSMAASPAPIARLTVVGAGPSGAPDPYDSSEPSSSSESELSESEDLDNLQGGHHSDDDKSSEVSEESDDEHGEENEHEDEDEDEEDDQDLRSQAFQNISQSQQQVAILSTPTPVPALPSANKYANYLHNDFYQLLSHVWDDCKDMHGALNQSKKMDFLYVGLRILASVPELLEAVVDGNVSLLKRDLRDNRPNDPLTRQMEKWDDRAAAQPSIYQRILVHEKTKQSPTRTELMKVIRNLRQYGRKGRGTMERKIDSLVGNWKEDRLRYAPDVDYHERQFQNAKTAKDKNEQAKKKQSAANRRKSFFQKVDEFCDKAESRLKKLPQNMWNKPLKNPWKYIGFAKNSEERNEKQHNKHVNSSPLMMLVEATAMYTLNVAAKSYLGPYRMEWSVVAYISGPDEATPSEIIMAVISEGYWFTGAGLAIEDSGKSNDVTDLDKKWSRFSTWTGSNTKYYERMKEQNDLIETKRNLRFVIKTHEAAAEARARGGQEGVEREIKRQLLARAIIGHQTISEGGKEAPLKAGQVRTSSSDDTSKSSMDGKKSTNEGKSITISTEICNYPSHHTTMPPLRIDGAANRRVKLYTSMFEWNSTNM